MADIAKITLKGESEAKNFIDEALRGDIAYEELSTTVSKAGGYVAGDHLIYLGQYYEVVADIAQGSTIVTSGAGQNVEEREVGDEIKKNKTQVVAQIQTLTSAFANNVNENGCKNRFVLTMEQLIKAQKSNGGTWNGNTYTFRGVTFTCNTDDSGIVESVTVNGTATNKAGFRFSHHDDVDVSKEYYKLFSENSYMVTGAKTVPRIVIDVNNGGTWVRTQRITSDSEVTLDLSGGDNITVYIEVPAGETANNVTIYPMLCLKSDYDIDPTYEPYSKTNRELTLDSVTWDDLSEVGAVNYLENKAVNTTSSPVTWTVDTNKIVTATVESNLTATNALDINLSFALSAGAYKLSGCPSGVDDGTTTICRLQLYKSDQTTVVALDNGSGAVFTLASDTVLVCKIRLGSGLASGTYTFYPMIAPVSYNGSYVPPAKTNKELTEIAEILADKGFLSVPDSGNVPNINPDNHKTVGLWQYMFNDVDYYGFSFIFNKDWVCQIRTQTRGTYLQYRIFNNTYWTEWKYLDDSTHRIYRGGTGGSETAKSKTFKVMDGYIYHVYGYYSTNYTHKMFTWYGSVVREFDLEQSGTVDCCPISIDGQNVTVSSAAQRYAQIQVFETQGAWSGESN